MTTKLAFRIWDGEKFVIEPRLMASLLNFPQIFTIATFGRTIQQSIGIVDGAGIVIFEGDVVRNQAGRTFVVEWCRRGFEYKEIAEVNGKRGIQPYWVNNIGDESLCQVIGNIFETPQLIGQ